jgi:hypothetical protein
MNCAFKDRGLGAMESSRGFSRAWSREYGVRGSLEHFKEMEWTTALSGSCRLRCLWVQGLDRGREELVVAATDRYLLRL